MGGLLNPIRPEQLQLTGLSARVAALEAGLQRVEALLNRRIAGAGRAQEAAKVARELLLPADVLEQGRVRDRRLLAAALREKGWSYQEIAHALGKSERTIERYFAPAPPAAQP